MMHHVHIKVALPATLTGSNDLYLTVRAGLVARGTTLNAWCAAQRINRQTAEKALKGKSHSRRAQELRLRLVDESFPGQLA
jgi:hypothetical protein